MIFIPFHFQQDNVSLHAFNFFSSSHLKARVPRALWEICIAVVATHAKTSNPLFCLVLALMTISTALIDIFIWAPGFAMFASFETCTGGGIFSLQPKICTTDYVKGAGRLFVSSIVFLCFKFLTLRSLILS